MSATAISIVASNPEAQMIHRLFLQHPRTVGENYGEHFAAASGFGFSMIFGGLACVVHGLIPGVFVTTGSDTVRRLHDRMVVNRRCPHVSDAAIAVGEAAE
ncbi:MAG: DUF6356 family protein [Sphingobium sp.]